MQQVVSEPTQGKPYVISYVRSTHVTPSNLLIIITIFIYKCLQNIKKPVTLKKVDKDVHASKQIVFNC